MLVDGHRKGKWQGRTRNDKLIFFQDGAERMGELLPLRVTQTGPWSLQGTPDGT